MKGFAADFGVKDMGSPDVLPNTRRALAIAEYARGQGKLDPFRVAAMEAHWRHRRNLEDEGHLRELVAGAGLDPDAAIRAGNDPEYLARVDAIRGEATERGVSGVPTFFIGNQVVVGCQPYEQLAGAARRAGATRR